MLTTLSQLTSFYANQNGECLEIPDLSATSLKQIVLIRHGEPDVDKMGYFTWETATQFVKDYDTNGIRNYKKSPVCTEGLPVDKIYHSTLRRAAHTTELLFGDTGLPFVADRRYREFERKVLKWLAFWPMPLHYWTYISRIFWVFGLGKKGIESFKEARKRTRENAHHLSELAQQENTVILVAHGFHNIYVMKYLKKMGWELVRKGGNGFIAVNVMGTRF